MGSTVLVVSDVVRVVLKIRSYGETVRGRLSAAAKNPDVSAISPSMRNRENAFTSARYKRP